MSEIEKSRHSKSTSRISSLGAPESLTDHMPTTALRAGISLTLERVGPVSLQTDLAHIAAESDADFDQEIIAGTALSAANAAGDGSDTHRPLSLVRAIELASSLPAPPGLSGPSPIPRDNHSP